MTRHVVPAVVRRPAHEIAARFAVRPAEWLKGFLLLATYSSPAADRLSSDNSWFGLGDPRHPEHGVVEVPFTWTSPVGGELFSEFTGRFVVAGDDTALVTLEGEAHGGDDTRNEAALVALVGLLVAAFSEA